MWGMNKTEILLRKYYIFTQINFKGINFNVKQFK